MFWQIQIQGEGPQKWHAILQDSPGKPHEHQRSMAWQNQCVKTLPTYLKTNV